MVAIIMGLGGLASGAPGPLTGADADRVEQLLPALLSAEARLAETPGLDVAVEIRSTMTELEGLLDRYFHAPNLSDPEARPHALRLRAALRAGFNGDPPLLVLRRDVIHFRETLHRALARALTAKGHLTQGIEQYLRALATAPGDPVLLKAVLDALESSADPRAGVMRARWRRALSASKASPKRGGGDD
jgi:hypothetical protein